MSYNLVQQNPETGELYLKNIAGGGGGALTMTKAEWEALSPKPADGTQVIITDDTSGDSENIIDDNSTTATDKTWSAKKINSYRIKAKEIEVSQGNDYNLSQIFGEQIVNVINIIGAGNKIDFSYSLLSGSPDAYTINIVNGTGRVRIFYI